MILRFFLSVLALVIGLLALLPAAAAWADYRFRGCPEYPNANQCHDARWTMRFLGGGGLALLAVAVLAYPRRPRDA